MTDYGATLLWEDIAELGGLRARLNAGMFSEIDGAEELIRRRHRHQFRLLEEMDDLFTTYPNFPQQPIPDNEDSRARLPLYWSLQDSIDTADYKNNVANFQQHSLGDYGAQWRDGEMGYFLINLAGENEASITTMVNQAWEKGGWQDDGIISVFFNRSLRLRIS